jgi:nucleotide-binding universal stress UspA family protein
MIKDLVVHLTGSDEDAVRLAYAEVVARRFTAHLTGLQVHALPEVVAITDPSGSSFLQELIADSNAEADKVTARLTERLNQIGPHAELRRLDVFPDQIGKALAAEARVADLFIGTRPYGDPGKQGYIEEAVLFNSGRGCIFLPPRASLREGLDTVFVAWKNTREAARAVAAALPFLKEARNVVVGLVEEGGASAQHGSEPGADIGRYLSRHGVKAEISMIAGWTDTAAALLDAAKGVGADLIVMGGYGHSRVREIILGGATRDVLTKAEIPVLMAH